MTGSNRKDRKPRQSGCSSSENYKPKYCEIARARCQLGATNAELAREFGVAVSTILAWQSSHPEFAEACKLDREHAIGRVERSFYEGTVGRTREVQKVMPHKGELVLVIYQVQDLPDPKASQYWLKNRSQRRWADKPTVDDETRDDPLTVLARQLIGTALRPRVLPPPGTEPGSNESDGSEPDGTNRS